MTGAARKGRARPQPPADHELACSPTPSGPRTLGRRAGSLEAGGSWVPVVGAAVGAARCQPPNLGLVPVPRLASPRMGGGTDWLGGLGEWAADHDGIVTLAQYAAARLADGSCCPAARRCRLLRTNCTPSTLPSRESFSMQPTLVGLPGKPGLDRHPGSKIAHHTGWPSWAARSTQLPLCWRRDLQRVLICRLREVRAMQGVGASSLMRRSRARHCEMCASGLAGTSPFMVNSTMAPGVDGLAVDGTKPIEEANDWRRGRPVAW